MEITKYNRIKLTYQEEIQKEIRGFFEHLYMEYEEGVLEYMEETSADIPALITDKDNETLDLPIL